MIRLRLGRPARPKSCAGLLRRGKPHSRVGRTYYAISPDQTTSGLDVARPARVDRSRGSKADVLGTSKIHAMTRAGFLKYHARAFPNGIIRDRASPAFFSGAVHLSQDRDKIIDQHRGRRAIPERADFQPQIVSRVAQRFENQLGAA